MYYLNLFVKYIFIFSTILYVFDKLLTNKNKSNKSLKILLVNIISIILSLLYYYISKFISSISTLIIFCVIISFINFVRYKMQFTRSLIITLLSSTITLSLYIICVVIASIISKLPFVKLNNTNLLILLITISLESIFLYKFFSLKRFKDGLSFLSDSNIINVVGILSIIFAGLSFIIYSSLNQYIVRVYEYLLIGIFLLFIGLIIWIKNQLIVYYKDLQKEKALAELEKELKEQKNININVNNDLEKISKINHRYSARISALDRWAKELDNSETIKDLKSAIYNLNEEYATEITKEFNLNNNFTKTHNPSLDILLDYFKNELAKDNIKFSFNLNIKKYKEFEEHISNSDLEILISNLINNSKNAINPDDSNNILLDISCVNGIYEISISDTGIPFEIDVLSKLGTERITTNKQSGGTGVGFITIFEILKKYNSSLIINEFSNNNIFTKTLTIRLDDKLQFIINSYRYNELKNNIDHRIILNNL